MKKKWEISRRHFLRSSASGMGSMMLGLPLLEAMIPSVNRAYAAGAAPPIRFVGLYTPNGLHAAQWNMTTPGTNGNFTLSPMLSGLAPFKTDMTILKGVDNVASFGGPQSPSGAHGRAPAATWTCMVPDLTNVQANINARGISFDQRLAQAFGSLTPKASIQMATSMNAGDTDSYHFEYGRISWASPTSLSPKYLNPSDIFTQLFGGFTPDSGSADFLKKKRRGQSLLDFVIGDANSLMLKLGYSDKQKMDEYLTSMRDIETKLNNELPPPDTCTIPAAPAVGTYTTAGQFNGVHVRGVDGQQLRLDTHLRLFFDIITVAMQCDASRIFMVMLEGGGSNRPFGRELGANYNYQWHGDFSHNGCTVLDNGTDYNTTLPATVWINGSPQQVVATATQASYLARFADINRFCYDQIGYLLNKLKSTTEADQNLLYNSVVMSVNELCDSNSHSHNNLPLILAGRAGGQLSHHGGQCVQFPSYNIKDWINAYTANTTRLGNLFVTLQQKIAAGTLAGLDPAAPNYASVLAATQALAANTSFGDSNGNLNGTFT